MTKHEYLKQYLNKWREIERLELELEQLRSRAERITSVIDGMPHSSKGGGFAPAADRIMDLQKILEKQVLEAIDIRLEIERKLGCISDKREQTVLKYRYINGYTFETIAELMNLSDRWVRIIHSQAIKNFYIADEKILLSSC